MTFNFVYNYFTEQGCELLETQYINSRVTMSYKCVCGNISKINWSNFKYGKRCLKCRGKKTGDLKRIPFEEVEKYFKEHGCELLDTYKSNNSKVKFRCNCGEIAEISYSCFRAGHRCRKCKYEKISNALSLSFEEVQQYFIEQGCELLETKYKNARTPLAYRCSCGNISKIVFCSFKNGNRCKLCGIEKNTGPNNWKWREDRELFKSDKLFKKKCYGMLRSTLKGTQQIKNNRTAVLLGYSFNDLREHIQSYPNWSSLKDGDWELDHIFPINAFLDYGIKNIKLINGLDNLQPLSQNANISKGAKYDSFEFEKWLKQKGIKI